MAAFDYHAWWCDCKLHFGVGTFRNVLLAFFIYAMILFKWGEERLPTANVKYGVITDSLAASAGIKDGDKITAVNGKPLTYFDDLPKGVVLNERVTLSINRNGVDTTVTLPQGFLSSLTRRQIAGFVYPRVPVIVKDDPEASYVSGELLKGDQIVAVNDQPVFFFDEFAKTKKDLKNQNITLKVLRGTDTVNVVAKANANAQVGIQTKDPYEVLGSEKKEYSFFESIPAGINYGMDRLGDYMTGIRLLFTSKEHKVSDNLGSVISIGKTFGGEWDWKRFWEMTAMFSIILAFMNILPIPALDGGHALFTIYEMITGRKPSDKFMEYAQMVGMALLLGLMLYAFGLDIWRLFR